MGQGLASRLVFDSAYLLSPNLYFFQKAPERGRRNYRLAEITLFAPYLPFGRSRHFEEKHKPLQFSDLPLLLSLALS